MIHTLLLHKRAPSSLANRRKTFHRFVWYCTKYNIISQANEISNTTKLLLGFNTYGKPTITQVNDGAFISNYYEYINLLGKYHQFYQKPSATRFIYNFSGLLSYQFYLAHSINYFTNMTTPWYMKGISKSRLSQPIIQIEYTIQVYRPKDKYWKIIQYITWRFKNIPRITRFSIERSWKEGQEW